MKTLPLTPNLSFIEQNFNLIDSHLMTLFSLNFYLLIFRKREKYPFVVLLIHAFIG